MFECHITIVKPENVSVVENIANGNGWKTSYIMSDIVLGGKPYFYFTCHNKQYHTIFEKMQLLDGLLSKDGIEVVRKKIELIVYDTKMNL